MHCMHARAPGHIILASKAATTAATTVNVNAQRRHESVSDAMPLPLRKFLARRCLENALLLWMHLKLGKDECWGSGAQRESGV
jgi:hypothetical protein